MIELQASIVGGRRTQELLEALYVRIECLFVINGDPREGLHNFAGIRTKSTREILLPIVVHTERGHPLRVRIRERDVPAHFDPVMERHGSVTEGYGGGFERGEVCIIEQQHDAGEAFGLPITDRFARNAVRRYKDPLRRMRSDTR